MGWRAPLRRGLPEEARPVLSPRKGATERAPPDGAAMRHDYTVVYQAIEDGWVMATVPELPGAVTQGRNLDEAREMIKEAVELPLSSYRENAARNAPGDAIWE